MKTTLVTEDNNDSCIVIITRDADVAKYCENDSLRANAKMDYDRLSPSSDTAIDGWERELPYSHKLLSNRIEEALGVPFQVSQNHMRQAVQKGIHSPHWYSNNVTAVWGTVGVGKLAIVRCSYYAEIVRKMGMIESYRHKYKNLCCFPDKDEGRLFKTFGWVDVPDPFDLVELSRHLFINLHLLDPERMEKAAVGLIQGDDPVQGCYDILRKGDCLVVIDGLRCTHDWDLIWQAFFKETECSTVVITTEEGVAKYCVNQEESEIINIRPVDENAAVDLFCEIAGGANLDNAKHIIPKCGGLPKIIEAVAQASCAFHQNDNLVVKLHTDQQFNHLRGLLSWMHSYFDACSDSVMPCIFYYLSVFPTNCKFRKGRLLRRWIAEGYSRATTDRTARENAENLFSELFDMGIVQKQAYNGMCQINGFFREFIISQQMEDNLVFVLEEHCKLNLQRTGQHLTIMGNWYREKSVFKSMDVSRLRSLTVYGKWEKFLISKKMKCIRVLDLEGMSDVEDDQLERIFGKLLSLKFIGLRGCRKITCLPVTLGGLKQLETLDVRGTRIVALPQAILKLQKIQYIRAGAILTSDGDDWTSLASSEDDDCDVVAASQPSAATPPQNCDGVATSSPQEPTSPQDDGHATVSCSMIRTQVSRWLCMPERKSQHGGVEVPVGIGNMAALHTLGVVNINSVHGKNFLLAELRKLSQLVKLRVCGINKDNWSDLCSALSYLAHLESLSLRFDDDDCLQKDFPKQPPRTLKSLRLYGPLHKVPVWIKQLVNLKKLDLEIIVSEQIAMEYLWYTIPENCDVRRLFVKPTKDVMNLCFDDYWPARDEGANEGDECANEDIKPRVLKIDCNSELVVTFETNCLNYIEVLIVYCSKESSFRVSSEYGLRYMHNLKTVWLKGSYSEADLEDLKGHIGRHKNKPSLKLKPEQPPSP